MNPAFEVAYWKWAFLTPHEYFDVFSKNYCRFTMLIFLMLKNLLIMKLFRNIFKNHPLILADFRVVSSDIVESETMSVNLDKVFFLNYNF
jgi:hypothetical protein